MSNLYFLQGFNNYFNRCYKDSNNTSLKFPDLIGYTAKVGSGNWETVASGTASANFNPNDGVNTEHTANLSKVNPDYMIIVDDDDEVLSRWFVLESTRIRYNQYKLTLRRDLLADFYTDIIGATAYIEKGTPTLRTTGNLLNPLVFNEEQLETNRIKAYQGQLKDKTGVSWIVGYFGKDALFEGTSSNTQQYQLTSTDKARHYWEFDASGYPQFNPTLLHFSRVNRDEEIIFSGTPVAGESTLAEQQAGSSVWRFTFDQYDGYYGTGDIITFYYQITSNYIEASYYENNEVHTATAYLPVESQHTFDATYDMFCIPCMPTDINNHYTVDGSNIVEDSNLAAMPVASALASKYGGYFYDLQILPYCPCRDYLTLVQESDTERTIVDDLNEKQFVRVYNEENEVVTYIFYCNRTQFDITINYSISMPSNVLDVKVKEGTEQWRLNSPNWGSSYDFSPYKNDGLTGFRVFATYKPTSPYVCIKPIYNGTGLYRAEYTDARGLVLQGDFSISYTKDQYESYVSQNKYFMDIFNRQIDNLTVSNNVAKSNTFWSGLSGTVSGAMSGAFTGTNVLGNWIGAVAGGALGAAASAGAAVRDYNNLVKTQNETLDYTVDNFNYSLKTMQAQPDTLAGIGVLNKSYTIYPTIEQYQATDIEIAAYRNKLTYNGCTVMQIDTISNYIQSARSYIKGRIIRLDTIKEDTHLLVEIAAEFNKGWFM